MKSKALAINIGLLIAASLPTFLLLNRYVTKTGALDGISLTEYLMDEFRLQVLNGISKPPYGPEGVPYGCRINDASLIPHCEGTFYGLSVRIAPFRVSINSKGIRDTESPLNKQQGMYRIFVLGDSYTFGEGVDNEDTYPEVLERELNALFARPMFEVFNLGVLGASTDEELYRLREFVEYSPDLIILQTSNNDAYECVSAWEKTISDLGIQDADGGVQYRLVENFWQSLPLEKQCSCVRSYLKEIINETHRAGIPLILYEFGTSSEKISCFKEAEGAAYFAHESRGRPFEVSRADHHLNRKGHIHAAGELLPLLVDIINESTPGLLALSSESGGYAHEP